MSIFRKGMALFRKAFAPKTVAPVQFTIPDPVLPARTKARTGKRWVMRRGGKRLVLDARPAGVRKYPANGVKP